MNFDYVIVGAGSAGCVLANRLTEDPRINVLLLEAGGCNRHPSVAIPAAFAEQFHSGRDWDLATDPEPFCNDRSLYIPRGKGLGGSSAMNAMLYVRGRPLDYDLWEADGCPGWGWTDVKPYFLRAEDNSRGDSDDHSTGGPLRVEDQRSPQELTRTFLQSAEALGIPYVEDYNGPEQDGGALAQVTQRAGRRWSTNDAYLAPVRRRDNLTVVTGADVTKVEIDGHRATGVTWRSGRRGTEKTALAAQEVILSAGAIASPQLLMLSGLGPAEHLREAGITVKLDSPGVGGNLQDHPFVVCIWDAPGRDSLAAAETPKAVAEWVLRRSGPLSSPVAEAFAFVRSRPGLPAADLQFHFVPGYFNDTAPTSTTAMPSPSGRSWSHRSHAAKSGCAPKTRPASRTSSPTRSPIRTIWHRSSPASSWPGSWPRPSRCGPRSDGRSFPEPTSTAMTRSKKT